MARSTYHQNFGNPLQRDRLPNSRPTLEFRCRTPRSSESAGIVLCWAVLLFATSMGVWFVLQRSHSLPTPPFLLVALTGGAVWLLFGKQPDEDASCGTSTAGAASFIERAIARLQQTSTNLGIACGVLVAFGFANLPEFAHQLAAAIVIGNLTRAYIKHFVGYCSTSPMPRPRAWALRRNCDRFALCLFAWPSIVVFMGHHFGGLLKLLLISVIAAALGAAIAGWRNPSKILSAPCEAILQWCTYNIRSSDAPGIYLSPVGGWLRRLMLTAVCTFLVGVAIHPLLWNHADSVLISVSNGAVTNTIDDARLPDPESVFSLILSMPALITILAPTILAWPLLVIASVRESNSSRENSWTQCVEDVRSSPDAIERESVFIARVLEDGSPVLVPRSVFHNHAHFLGDSGSGKTALGLAPFCEQMIQFGDCSFLTIDMKADSPELYASMEAGAEALNRESGKELSIKHFTIQPGLSTYAFNPLTQPHWHDFDPYIKADILCGAFGLNYGTGYGAGFYSSANAEVLYQLICIAPEARTFRELVDAMDTLLSRKGPKALLPDLRAAGLHVQMVLKRLASIDALNQDPRTASADIAENQIDLSSLFQRPQLLYFSLSCTLAPGVAPEIARIAIYSLLCSATLTKQRKCQVFLVIDEFQRIVADNLEYILQLARSMNVGVILANQSMEDLRTATSDLIPTLEANCRFRQWFAVSSSDDRARVVANCGEAIDLFEVMHVQEDGVNYAYAQQVVPRLNQNDVLLISDHPMQSIVTVTHGAGYAQYGGMAIAVESEFHISVTEYMDRKQMPWPSAKGGAFIPQELRASRITEVTQSSLRGPVVTTEFFGRHGDDEAAGAVALPPRPGSGPRKPTAGRR